MYANRWSISLSPLAQSKINQARSVMPEIDLLAKAIFDRLSHDPYIDAQTIKNNMFALVIEPVTDIINVNVYILYLVGENKILIKNLQFK